MTLNTILLLAITLFAIGLTITLVRKELLFMLMGIEVMFNGAALAAIGAAHYWHSATGQVLTLFIMVVAGAELAVSLVIVMHCYRRLNVKRIDQLTQLRDTISTEAV